MSVAVRSVFVPEEGSQPLVLAAALGHRWIAVRAAHVREVLGRASVVPIPGSKDGLVGVMAWRGRAVAVLDLGPAVGEPAFAEPRGRTLVLEVGLDTIAVPVDRVREARAADSSRPTHATRTSFASIELDVGGEIMPLFEPVEWLAALDGGQA
jgi:chemotaxis signal transduction protein